ncbi:MAG: hypothetical protein WCQ10_07320 [Chitinophagia bacterium]
MPKIKLKGANFVNVNLLRYKKVNSEVLVFSEIINSTELYPKDWENHDEQIMQIIYCIRHKAFDLIKNYKKRFEGNFTPLEIYNLYLLHHASRFCRYDDPEIEMDPRRLEYMWFTLSLMAKFLKTSNLEAPVRKLHNNHNLETVEIKTDTNIEIVARCDGVKYFAGCDGVKYFKVESIKNDRVIYLEDLPLDIWGSYLGDFGDVWVVLQDTYGNYYLQNPPVVFFNDGRWHSVNIVPGADIASISFIEVDQSGNQLLRVMVKQNNWNGFKILPQNSKNLATVRINVKTNISYSIKHLNKQKPCISCKITIDTNLPPIKDIDLPIEIQGFYTGIKCEAWIFLKDKYRRYYLQN